jgi:hypothetical protein
MHILSNLLSGSIFFNHLVHFDHFTMILMYKKFHFGFIFIISLSKKKNNLINLDKMLVKRESKIFKMEL